MVNGQGVGSTAILLVRDVQLGPLAKLAVEGPAADPHEFGGAGAVAPGLDQGLPQEPLLVFLHGELVDGRAGGFGRGAYSWNWRS